LLGRFEIDGRAYTIVHGHATQEDSAERAPTAEFLRAISRDSWARARLRRYLVADGVFVGHSDELSVLERALFSGRLVVYRGRSARADTRTLTALIATTEEVTYEPPPPAEHDWIEIELADEEGVPIEGAMFELTLPDGGKRNGRTDQRGRFHVPRTDAGQCSIRWTRLHAVERARRFSPAEQA